MGTLGHEEEIRRLKKDMVPKKVKRRTRWKLPPVHLLAEFDSAWRPAGSSHRSDPNQATPSPSHHPALTSSQILTKLVPGASFGGGPAAMGVGDLQTSLKVLADTDCELYHMHIDMFLKHATPRLLK